MPNSTLIEIKDGSTYTLNEYSVWLQVETHPGNDKYNKTIMIHPSAFDSIKKAIEKAEEIGNVSGDEAVKRWDAFVFSQHCKGAVFGRTSRYARAE